MQGDGEMFFLHYYLQKGFSLEYLLVLSSFEKIVYSASMEAEIKRQEEVYGKWQQAAEQVRF